MEIPFICFYCREQCYVDPESGSVFHPMPMCKAFRQYDVVDFIELSRKAMEKERGITHGD